MKAGLVSALELYADARDERGRVESYGCIEECVQAMVCLLGVISHARVDSEEMELAKKLVHHASTERLSSEEGREYFLLTFAEAAHRVEALVRL